MCRAVLVRWVLAEATPLGVRLEYSADGIAWRTLSASEPKVPAGSPAGSEVTRFDVSAVGKQRFWRVVAERMVENGAFAIRDIYFEP